MVEHPLLFHKTNLYHHLDIYFNPNKENTPGLIYFAKDERQKINNHEDTKIIVSSDHQSESRAGLDRTQKHGRVTEQ